MIKIRRFNEDDIELKVKWINDSENNRYLHYDIPISYENTMKWFNRIKDQDNRLDLTILYNNNPVGLIGLLNIDYKNRKAEYYIVIGESKYKGKGIAYDASKLLLEQAKMMNLRKIYLYTEIKNINAQILFEKLGFIIEGMLKNDLFDGEKFIDRYLYSIDLLTSK